MRCIEDLIGVKARSWVNFRTNDIRILVEYQNCDYSVLKVSQPISSAFTSLFCEYFAAHVTTAGIDIDAAVQPSSNANAQL